MKNMNCKDVRKEIDEVLPKENFSEAVNAHLKGCAVCLDLYHKQMRLQHIVRSMEAVAVPHDFDFRLRARLTEAQPPTRLWSFSTQGAGLAAALLLVVSAIIGFQFMKRVETPVVVGIHQENKAAEDSKPIQSGEKAIATAAQEDPTQTAIETAHGGAKQSTVARSVAAQRTSRRAQAAVDFSSQGASRITQESAFAVGEGPAFPIDAPLQGLRLSLDDGRGNARTISFPTVSFGSQRVLTSTTQPTPKGVW